MDATEAILSRRSIRKYRSDPLSDRMVQQLLEAAMSAPSAGNEQPWHFVVITKRKILDAIPSFHPHAQMLREAPLAIVVCGDLSLEKFGGYWVQDCSAATQNILLAAHALGLGGVWTGLYPDEERVLNMKKLLNIPESVVPLSLVPVGFPAEEKPRSNRYDGGRIHYDLW